MANRFIFADEAGCFTFKAHKGASKYFLLCTLTTDDCSLSNDLLDFRRELALSNEADRNKLHASEDRQHVRDRVFEILSKHNFRIDATIFEKAKAQRKSESSTSNLHFSTNILPICLVLSYEISRVDVN